MVLVISGEGAEMVDPKSGEPIGIVKVDFDRLLVTLRSIKSKKKYIGYHSEINFLFALISFKSPRSDYSLRKLLPFESLLLSVRLGDTLTYMNAEGIIATITQSETEIPYAERKLAVDKRKDERRRVALERRDKRNDEIRSINSALLISEDELAHLTADQLPTCEEREKAKKIVLKYNGRLPKDLR